jgi:hypothetical protein
MPGNPFGNAITNQISYMANTLGRGQIPYTNPRAVRLPLDAMLSGPGYQTASFLNNVIRGAAATGAKIGKRFADQTASSFIGPIATGTGSIGPTSVPGRNVGQQAFLNGKPVYWTGNSWMSSQGAAANREGGFFAQGPADRAYAQEVSRTAQLTAQNPEMQRYEAARQADLKSGDFSKSEDIGMEMWARKNKTLAKAVKPGQAGYDVIQRVLQEDAKPNVGAFAETTPIFPGAQNYFSGQYQATPGATTPDLGAFTTQQNIPFAPPQSIGQFPFQPPTQAPVLTQGFGAAPGIDSLGAFTREQLSQELLKKFAGLQK